MDAVVVLLLNVGPGGCVGTMSGKTCLVTGATSGIGQETALRLAMLGASVIVVARDAARGEAAGDEIRQRVPSAQVEAMTADLSSLAQVRRLAAARRPIPCRNC
jgi:short-subunit dehydrogenase